MSAGEVVRCAHCGGTGRCDCPGCNVAADVHESVYWRVQCSACGGVGKVWVGPNNGDEDEDDDDDDDEG